MAARHNAVDRYLEPHERIKKIVIGKKNIEEQENKLESVEIEEEVKRLEAEPLPSEPGAVLPEEPDVVLPEEPDVVLPEEPDDVLPANTAQYEILPSEYKEPLKSSIDGSISKKRHSCVLCDVSFDHSGNLRKHYCVIHFKVLISREIGSNMLSKLQCPKCKKKDFQNKNSLLSHFGTMHKIVDAFIKKAKKLQSKPFINCFKCDFQAKTRMKLDIHYSLKHFRDQIDEVINGSRCCPICETEFPKKKTDLITHVGLVHDIVDQFLPKEHQLVKFAKSLKIDSSFDVLHTSSSLKTEDKTNENKLFKTAAKVPKLTEKTEAKNVIETNSSSKNNLLEEDMEVENEETKTESCKMGKAMAKENVSKVDDDNNHSSPLKCQLCDYKSVKPSHLTHHYCLVHFKDEILNFIKDIGVCGLCDFKASSEQHMILHYGREHKYVDLCLESLIKEKTLASCCTLCNHELDGKSNLYAHYSLVHFKQSISEAIESTSRKDEDRTKCGLCEYRSSKLHNMIIHFGIKHNCVDELLNSIIEGKVPKLTIFSRSEDINSAKNPDKRSAKNNSVKTSAKISDKTSLKIQDNTFAKILDIISSKITDTVSSKIPDNTSAKIPDTTSSKITDTTSSKISDKTSSKIPNKTSAKIQHDIYSCYKCSFSSLAQNRSKMYDHYSNTHFKKEILEKIGNHTSCFICPKPFHQDMRHNIIHVGVTHSIVEDFLPKKYHIPKKTRGKTIHYAEYCQAGTSEKRSEEHQILPENKIIPEIDSVQLNEIENEAREVYIDRDDVEDEEERTYEEVEVNSDKEDDYVNDEFDDQCPEDKWEYSEPMANEDIKEEFSLDTTIDIVDNVDCLPIKELISSHQLGEIRDQHPLLSFEELGFEENNVGIFETNEKHISETNKKRTDKNLQVGIGKGKNFPMDKRENKYLLMNKENNKNLPMDKEDNKYLHLDKEKNKNLSMKKEENKNLPINKEDNKNPQMDNEKDKNLPAMDKEKDKDLPKGKEKTAKIADLQISNKSKETTPRSVDHTYSTKSPSVAGEVDGIRSLNTKHHGTEISQGQMLSKELVAIIEDAGKVPEVSFKRSEGEPFLKPLDYLAIGQEVTVHESSEQAVTKKSETNETSSLDSSKRSEGDKAEGSIETIQDFVNSTESLMNPDESQEIIAEEKGNTLSFDKKMLNILSKEESSSEEESETEAEPPASNSNPKSISEAAPDRVKSPAVLSNQEEASQNQMQVRSSEVMYKGFILINNTYLGDKSPHPELKVTPPLPLSP